MVCFLWVTFGSRYLGEGHRNGTKFCRHLQAGLVSPCTMPPRTVTFGSGCHSGEPKYWKVQKKFVTLFSEVVSPIFMKFAWWGALQGAGLMRSWWIFAGSTNFWLQISPTLFNWLRQNLGWLGALVSSNPWKFLVNFGSLFQGAQISNCGYLGHFLSDCHIIWHG